MDEIQHKHIDEIRRIVDEYRNDPGDASGATVTPEDLYDKAGLPW